MEGSLEVGVLYVSTGTLQQCEEGEREEEEREIRIGEGERKGGGGGGGGREEMGRWRKKGGGNIINFSLNCKPT